MSDWIKSVMQTFSYPGIVFLMFLENVFPPIPSELIMPLAGFFSTTGELSLWGTILAGTVGSVLGAVPLYYLGKYAGETRLRRWLDRRGKWIGLSSADLEKSRRWFDQHGAKTVLFCRLIPGVRSLISIPAGIAGMNLGVFVGFTTVGSAVWTAVLAFAGRALGGNYEQVERVVGPISTGVIVLIVGTILFRAFRLRHARAT
jgi:membrane protein DedA with SNARE-associated domain